VAEAPAQIAVGEVTAVIVGLVLTTTANVLVFEHPAAFTPVTVYVVVTVGFTTTLDAIVPPGFHVYDVAPVAERVTDPTIQIAVGDAVALIVGLAFTTKATVRVAVQPKPFAPVIVYVVDVAGDTITVVPVKAPGFQE
jgi:hypothetical protein